MKQKKTISDNLARVNISKKTYSPKPPTLNHKQPPITISDASNGSTGAPQVGSGQSNLIVQPQTPDPSNLASKNTSQLKLTNLNKTVFDKEAFNDTINTSFTELGDSVIPDPSFFDINLATQENFWTLYDKFFFEIPKDGTTDSHEYLSQTSGDYANFERDQEAIQDLLNEIAEIRTENVELRILNIDLNTLISTTKAKLAIAST
jgi:hypothetical protein